MNKLKNFMQKISGDFKILIKNFPITMFIILIVTLVATISINTEFSRETEEILEKFYMFSGIWGLGTFFSETFFSKKIRKSISYIVTAIISFVFTILLQAENVDELTVKLLSVYILFLSTMTVYKSIKNAELSFEEYILKGFRDFLNNSIVYVVLNIGLLLLSVIFVELILNGKYGDIVPTILTLLFGGFYVPSLIHVISSINKSEENGFVKGLVTKVLLPLVIAAIAIVYLYIAKIIILQDMPENIIFRILAGIFVVAFPVWNMAKNYREEKPFINKIIKVLQYLYIPFVLLEIYSIGVRIADYGVTELRYSSCIFIILQVIILFFEIYKKGKNIEQIFIIFAIIGTITILGPLSCENVSNRSQGKIFEEILPEGTEFQELTNEEKIRVQSIYRYLKYSEEYIPEYISEETIKEIYSYTPKNEEDDIYREYETFYENKKLELDVTGYRKIEIIDRIYSNNSQITIEENSVDMSSFVNEIIRKQKDSEEEAEIYFENNNIVKINDFQEIYISDIGMKYYVKTNEIEYLNIDGYLLEK